MSTKKKVVWLLAVVLVLNVAVLMFFFRHLTVAQSKEQYREMTNAY